MTLTHTILLAGLGGRIEEFLVPVLEAQGHVVHTAVGLEATYAALAASFDLLLVDMPSEHELPYLRDLRRRCGCAMMVIAPRNDRLLVAALEQGADDYVSRPFRTDELLARIRAQLRRIQRNGA
jgi:DNA-binding response OmpR family regulator